MVKAEGVQKSFGRLEVLKGVSLEVQPGEVVCMIGASGSGKSTFLRCINHLERIDAGRQAPALHRGRHRRVQDLELLTIHECSPFPTWQYLAGGLSVQRGATTRQIPPAISQNALATTGLA